MNNFEIYYNIPDEMKSINRWVCLSMVEEGGKVIKKPVSAYSGKVASITDEENWADFATALKYYQEHQDRINGIGFVFADTDDIVGIDFDDCLDNDGNLINDAIQAIVSRTNSYIERSVSGTGLHVYVRGKLPTTTGVKLSTENSPHGFGIELYEQNVSLLLQVMRTLMTIPNCR